MWELAWPLREDFVPHVCPRKPIDDKLSPALEVALAPWLPLAPFLASATSPGQHVRFTYLSLDSFGLQLK